MTFEEKLNTYAELLVKHGLNVQPGQVVNISTEVIHRDFAQLIAEHCYKVGAKYVLMDLSDPRLGKARLSISDKKHFDYVPKHLTVKYDELVEECGANIRLIGSEFPNILEDADPTDVNTIRMHQRLALQNFYDQGIGRSKVHWVVAAAATPAWGKNIFPDLDPEAACAKLWEEIFAICRADKPDCLAQWKLHNNILQNRARTLTALKIKELHFTGPDTDLKVGLSNKAIFKGGGEKGPRGVEFEPNVPTEEVFTTPDFRKTTGFVRATRPFMINGVLIKNLRAEFKDGVLVNYEADAGKETFRAYIESDEGAKRLGEVALVGIDSPIYKSGAVFQEILFDENAACHIAIGSAYKFCLEGGALMSKEEAAELGCNESSVHTDMMISSEQVSVQAITYDGAMVELIKNGSWTKQFA